MPSPLDLKLRHNARRVTPSGAPNLGVDPRFRGLNVADELNLTDAQRKKLTDPNARGVTDGGGAGEGTPTTGTGMFGVPGVLLANCVSYPPPDAASRAAVEKIQRELTSAGLTPRISDIPPGLLLGQGLAIERTSTRIEFGGVSQVCQAFCERPTQQRWRLVSLRVEGSDPSTPALLHWADFQLAGAWAAWAKAYADDTQRAARLDRVLPDPDFGVVTREATRDAWEAQVDYVRDLFECIAQYYNALNIPWFTDKEARDLWQKWIVGNDSDENLRPSEAFDYNNEAAYSKEDFGDRGNINPYRNRLRLKRGEASRARAGIIPREALRMADKMKGGTPINLDAQFHQAAGLMFTPLAGERSNNRWIDPSLATTSVNRGFAVPVTLNYIQEETRWDRGFRDLPHVGRTDARRNEDESNDRFERAATIADWRTFSYDLEGAAGQYQLAAPLQKYVAWAKEWIEKIHARTPREVLRSAREYVLLRNLRMITAFGGIEGFWESMGARDADLKAWFDRPNPALKTAETITRSIGGIGGAVGFAVGGPLGKAASDLAFGFVGESLGLIATAIGNPAPPDDKGKDDLGRWKPSLDRSFLGGKTAAVVGETLQDTRPPELAKIPPGFCYVTPDPDDVVNEEEARVVVPNTTLVPTDEGMSALGILATIGGIMGGAALLGLGGWGLYKVLQRPSAPPVAAAGRSMNSLAMPPRRARLK